MIENLIFVTLEAAILYYVAKEYYESRETNKVLTQLMNKQRKQKIRVSVDRVIKAAIKSGENNE